MAVAYADLDIFEGASVAGVGAEVEGEGIGGGDAGGEDAADSPGGGVDGATEDGNGGGEQRAGDEAGGDEFEGLATTESVELMRPWEMACWMRAWLAETICWAAAVTL